MKGQRSIPTSRRRPEVEPGEILLPRWIVFITIVASWVAGGLMLAFELTAEMRFAVLLLAAWLITWPVVATNPMEALGDFLRGVLPGSSGGKDRA